MSMLSDTVARIILTGPFEQEAMIERLKNCFPQGSSTRWVRPLVKCVWQRFSTDPIPPRHRVLVRFLKWDYAFELKAANYASPPDAVGSTLPAPSFHPLRDCFTGLGLPEMATERGLADWLGITPGKLLWLAGRYQDRDRNDAFDRYRTRWTVRGPSKVRLLEIPRPQLKRTQRILLDELIGLVPVHDAAHGFRPGRSVLTFIRPHVGQEVVWRTDLANFFLSIHRPRVYGLFRLLGYPEQVSDLLAGLTTHRVDRAALGEVRPTASEEVLRELQNLLPNAHLPQGAPSSPALANLVTHRLDRRLTGLAARFDAHYTRYADDLVFSGRRYFKRHLAAFRVRALAIIVDEGFAIRRRKSIVMAHGRRQQVAGVIVNDRPNISREEYKRLHAILHNCVVAGADSQNRAGHDDFRAHLQGKIAYARLLHPDRGERLQRLFDAIDWP